MVHQQSVKHTRGSRLLPALGPGLQDPRLPPALGSPAPTRGPPGSVGAHGIPRDDELVLEQRRGAVNRDG